MIDKTMAHAELDVAVKSLHSVGGVCGLVTQCVEYYNRPHCVEEEP